MILKNKSMLLAVVALLACGGCKDKQDNPKANAQVPLVDTIVLKPQDIPLSFEFAARAQGSKETEVRARVGGILIKRNYVEGSSVDEGSVLFQIDPVPFEVQLNSAKAKLAQAKSQLTKTESQWNRTRKLHKEGYASGKDYDEAKARFDSAKASEMMAQAEVDEAQLNLDYTTVKAPISGITSLETQSEGSLISPSGKAGLLTSITQINPMYVIFSASENELLSLANMTEQGLIRKMDEDGENHSRKVKAKVKFGNGKVYPLEGDINFINPSLDKATGTMKLRAVFPNPEGRLRPGMFLRLMMEGLYRIDALVVPQEAIMQNAESSYVYRIGANGLVEEVNVQTGIMTKDGGWIIDNGLNDGDEVIVSGVMKLRAGMRVKSKNSSDK